MTASALCAARQAADEAERMFSALGFPKPARCVSGNGAHLVYRIALPNTDESKELLRIIYSGLARDLSIGQVLFDPKTRTAAQIAPLYGVVKRKGQPTPERPHRQSVIQIPKRWKQVPINLLTSLANFYLRQNTPAPVSRVSSAPLGRGDYRTLDGVAWFRAHGAYKRSLGLQGTEVKHAVICPWVHEHSTPDHPLKTDTVLWTGAGVWPTCHCSHAHCEGRDIRSVMVYWADADQFCSATSWGMES